MKYLIVRRSFIAAFIIFELASICLNAVEERTGNAQLDSLLQKYRLNDDFLKGKATKITFRGLEFNLDDKGIFYTKDKEGNKHPLDIYINKETLPKKQFVIFDPHAPKAGLPTNPMKTGPLSVEQAHIFDDIVSSQRQHGIFSIKHKHPMCYVAYVFRRLDSANPVERIIAMEREENPRPLPFPSDADWNDFKDDLRAIFNPFKGPHSYLAIIGTSTTFFSENPRKGQNAPLFESPPACLQRAKDPVASLDVYTYDMPNMDPSDIDIHVFIPELSDLCHKASVHGNTGDREVYAENTMDECLRKSSDESVRALVGPVSFPGQFSLQESAVPEKALGNFFKKWGQKLKKLNKEREINFSVHIRPDQRKAPMTQPNVKDFSTGPFARGRFVIPVN